MNNTLCNKSQSLLPSKISFSFFAFIFALQISYVASAQVDGAKLFKQNCAVCHSLGTNKLTGPGLEGVLTRVPSEDWMHKWIKNNQALIKSGDAYANKIYTENGGAQMTVFEDLSDADISAIIGHIKNPPKEQVKVAVAQAEGQKEENPLNSILILLGIVVFLVITISVLRNVKRSLKNVINEKQGLPEIPHMNMWEGLRHWTKTHKRGVAVIIIILLSIGSKAGWDAMFEIGVYQGYKPEQPIKFSHKIHAGENAISCEYCHSSVLKSRHAGIPSTNVCMNCHKGIQKGSVTGDTEIKKIYEAIGYNPDSQKYDKPQKPVRWIKVHNLPDFVYFNHSQHVVVGKQECQTCHGEIQKMDVVEQHSPLTMGWCIDCHKKTEVAMAGNPYYEELHKKLAEKYKGQKITVDKMGGIECSKCHY
jgi:mono/diheme cytochrome c family protein